MDRLGLREDAGLLLSRGEQTQTYEGAILMDQHIGDLIVTDVTIVSRHVTGLTHVKPGGNLVASGGLLGGLKIEAGANAVVSGGPQHSQRGKPRAERQGPGQDFGKRISHQER